MYHPDLTVLDFMEKFIGLQQVNYMETVERVKHTTHQLHPLRTCQHVTSECKYLA